VDEHRDSSEQELLELASQDTTPWEKVQQAQLKAIVQVCIARLSPQHREVLFWVYYEDCSVQQAADHLNCAVGTVKSRLFHARAQVGACVQHRVTEMSVS
jgi:RNA polymerase sigma-70 factor, ECF subfamily